MPQLNGKNARHKMCGMCSDAHWYVLVKCRLSSFFVCFQSQINKRKKHMVINKYRRLFFKYRRETRERSKKKDLKEMEK